jgi:hypothetical protein
MFTPARVLLLLLLTTGTGCRCGGASTPAVPPAPPPPPVPALGDITIQDLTPPEERPPGAVLAVEPLEANVRSSLGAARLFAQPPDAGAAVRARVRMEISLEDVVAGDKAAARAAVRMRIDTRPSEVAADHWNEDVQAGSETIYKPGPTTDRKALFEKLVTRTISDLVAG